MNLLSFKAIALRYGSAVVLLTLAGLASNPSGLFVVIPVSIVSIKFLMYDGIAAAVSSKLPSFRVHPWLLLGYSLTIVGDMLFVYSANSREADAGFALFGTFLLTPWVLIAALVTMGAATFLARKK